MGEKPLFSQRAFDGKGWREKREEKNYEKKKSGLCV